MQRLDPLVHRASSPASQVTIIAGLMIIFSNRRSIILKVSDCFEPA
jgi:hypothetical protein